MRYAACTLAPAARTCHVQCTVPYLSDLHLIGLRPQETPVPFSQCISAFKSHLERTKTHRQTQTPDLQGIIASFNLQCRVTSLLQCAPHMLLQLYCALPTMLRNLSIPRSQSTRPAIPAGSDRHGRAEGCPIPCAPCQAIASPGSPPGGHGHPSAVTCSIIRWRAERYLRTRKTGGIWRGCFRSRHTSFSVTCFVT